VVAPDRTTVGVILHTAFVAPKRGAPGLGPHADKSAAHAAVQIGMVSITSCVLRRTYSPSATNFVSGDVHPLWR
jgi:hypothetical protein